MSQSKPTGSTVHEVKFGLSDSRYPFVDISQKESCRLSLAEMFPRTDGRYAEYFQVRGVCPDQVAADATASDGVDVTILTEYEDGGCLEFLVSEDCPAFRLVELGALPREVHGVEGDGWITAEIPAIEEPSEVIEIFLDEYPDATLLSKREKDGIEPRFCAADLQEILHNHLTDRQGEILEKAFEEGYYDWPRECTGEAIAAELEISTATFSEHIRAAERKLLSSMFKSPDSDPP